MDVKILSQPAFSVMGLLERGIDAPTLIPPIWNRYFSHWEKVEPHILSHTAYGVMDNYDETSGAFDYLAGHAVSADLQALPGLTVWQIPIQLYAVLACTVPSVRDAYVFFTEEWLPTAEYARSHGSPEFEVYPEEFKNLEHDTMYLYIPIQKTKE